MAERKRTTCPDTGRLEDVEVDRTPLGVVVTGEHREALAAVPAFFYSVGGHGVFDRDGYIQRMTRRTGWHPTVAATFADASAVQQPDIRAFAQQIADEVPAVPQPCLI